eukprot:SAG11_NODE_19132_length_473_cov_1.521390_1_plen_45_part_10
MSSHGGISSCNQVRIFESFKLHFLPLSHSDTWDGLTPSSFAIWLE